MILQKLQCPIPNFDLINNVEDMLIYKCKSVNSDDSYLFSWSRNAQISFLKKPRSKIISFQNYKHFHLIDTSDKGFKSTVKNQALSFNIFAWKIPWNYVYIYSGGDIIFFLFKTLALKLPSISNPILSPTCIFINTSHTSPIIVQLSKYFI